MLFSPDIANTLICDLEGRWGNPLAPEVSFRQPVLDAVSTEKSDIYDLGQVIKGMRYGNAPMTNLVEWPVHPPLSGIVETCTRELPHERQIWKSSGLWLRESMRPIQGRSDEHFASVKPLRVHISASTSRLLRT